MRFIIILLTIATSWTNVSPAPADHTHRGIYRRNEPSYDELEYFKRDEETARQLEEIDDFLIRMKSQADSFPIDPAEDVFGIDNYELEIPSVETTLDTSRDILNSFDHLNDDQIEMTRESKRRRTAGEDRVKTTGLDSQDASKKDNVMVINGGERGNSSGLI